MKTLFHQRLTAHLKEMAKYLRYVFNDFFIFALLFFLGGLGWAYANALKTLSFNSLLGGTVSLLVLFIGSQLGRFATLVEDADAVFLIPRERDMHAYFVQARRYSFWMAGSIQAVLLFLLAPFVSVTLNLHLSGIVALVIMQLALKDALLRHALLRAYRDTARWVTQRWWVDGGLTVIILVVALFWSPVLGAVLALGADGLVAWYHQRTWAQRRIAWRHQIAFENNRMLGVYRFFNLFTDVPMVSGQVKRRRWLDGILGHLPLDQAHTYLNLFSRGMVRGSEFSGLYVRLTGLGLLILIFLKGLVLPLVLGALFLYLIGFQLLPFYTQYDDIVFTHIYPLPIRQKGQAFVQLVTWLLSMTGGLFTLMTAIATQSWVSGLAMAVVMGLEVLLLARIYTPRRLARISVHR